MAKKRRRKLRTEVKRAMLYILVFVIVGIYAINESIKIYKEEQYKKTDEYKLIEIGYEKEKAEYIINNTNDEIINYLKTNNYNETYYDIISSKYYLNKNFECLFEIDDLYPNYKPSTGRIISDDVVNGWLLLTKMFPKELGNFPINSSDEAFLNFAEKLANSDLQLAVISYVEILIDIESCELSYKDKYLKYQEKHIKKIMYEEYMARKER